MPLSGSNTVTLKLKPGQIKRESAKVKARFRSVDSMDLAEVAATDGLLGLHIIRLFADNLLMVELSISKKFIRSDDLTRN